MFGFVLCAALTGVVVDSEGAVSGWDRPEERVSVSREPRAFHDLHRDLRDAFRQESTISEPAQWALVVVRLTELYGEIMRDPRLAASDTLQGYRHRLRARLLSVQRRLERELARAERTSPRAEESARRAGDSLAAVLWLNADVLGGVPTLYRPDGLGVWGAWGGGARGDYGESLVELIRRTISPEFWDVQGGPGVIVYYAPWHALVVRATAEVHRRVGGLMEDLRK